MKRALSFVPAVAVLVVFVVVGMLVPSAPGLYMDAVNPDYLVVRILHPAAPVRLWIMPGNELFDRFPVLAGLYSGTYCAYWAIPFYLLFGGSILGVRVAHVASGIVILASAALLFKRLGTSRTLAFATLLLLVLDPAFTFVFRTQADISIFPIALTFASIALLYERSVSKTFWAGVLAGLAGFGYFILFLFIPGQFAFVATDRSGGRRRERLLAMILGCIVGVAPYVLGYGLIFQTLGLSGGSQWLHDVVSSMHVDSGQGFLERGLSVAHQVRLVFTNEWEWLTFFGTPHADAGAAIKAALLLFVPMVAIVAFGRRLGRPFAAVAYPLASYLACATFFGGRFGGHEYALLVPLAYVVAAVSVQSTLASGVFPSVAVKAGVAGMAAVVSIVNAVSSASMVGELSRSRGANLYSELISSFATGALASNTREPYVFWTWGEMMPFIYVTGGAIPAYDGASLDWVLCTYRRAHVVLLGPDAVAPLDPAITGTGATLSSDRLVHDPTSAFPLREVTLAGAARTCGPAKVGQSSEAGYANAVGSVTVASRQLATGVRFSATPSSFDLPAGATPKIVDISWAAPVANVEIRAQSPDGLLFASGGSTGTARTGPWMQPGIKLFLQDTTRGEPGTTLGELDVVRASR